MKVSTYRLKNIAGKARKRIEHGVDDFETILLDTLKDIESCCTLPQQLHGFIAPVYRVAASEFQILEHMVRGRQKTQRAARARHAVAMAAEALGLSHTEIGVAMQRDRSTVVHAVNAGRKLLAKNRAFAAAYASMLRRLGVAG